MRADIIFSYINRCVVSMVEQLELFALKSPCIGDCVANEKGYCRSCLRSRRERQEWNTSNNDTKRNIIRLCVRRRKVLEQYFIDQQKSEAELPEQMTFDF